jgi:hypothetical protein
LTNKASYSDLEENEAFRDKFNDLVNERIPQRYQHLSFGDMRRRKYIDLRTILNGIDSESLRMVSGKRGAIKELQNPLLVVLNDALA